MAGEVQGVREVHPAHVHGDGCETIRGGAITELSGKVGAPRIKQAVTGEREV